MQPLKHRCRVDVDESPVFPAGTPPPLSHATAAERGRNEANVNSQQITRTADGREGEGMWKRMAERKAAPLVEGMALVAPPSNAKRLIHRPMLQSSIQTVLSVCTETTL